MWRRFYDVRPAARTVVRMMIDFLFALGQALSVMLLLYGAILVIPPRRAPRMDPALEDELLLLRHMRNDA
jgi:hypothetical protein